MCNVFLALLLPDIHLAKPSHFVLVFAQDIFLSFSTCLLFQKQFYHMQSWKCVINSNMSVTCLQQLSIWYSCLIYSHSPVYFFAGWGEYFKANPRHIISPTSVTVSFPISSTFNFTLYISVTLAHKSYVCLTFILIFL